MARLLGWIGDAAVGALDLAAEGCCASCGRCCREELCAPCLAACVPVPGPVCPRCGEPPGATLAPGCERCRRFGRPFAFQRAVAMWRYGAVVRRTVLAFKFGSRPDVLVALGRRMARCPTLGSLLRQDSGALVVPLPARRAARQRRGYDQALLLARGVAQGAGLPMDPRALVRRRQPPGPQAGRSLHERRRGPRAGFRARAGRLAGRPVFLVDDVLSSGSTADAASRALLCAGAASVVVLALAT